MGPILNNAHSSSIVYLAIMLPPYTAYYLYYLKNYFKNYTAPDSSPGTKTVQEEI